MANLEKARAALKAQGYKETPKRKTSNLANLGKAQAGRRAKAARLAADLEVALPPPAGQDEAVGQEVLEQVGRTILRRWGSMRRGIKQERRQVMELLSWAAGRVEPASLEELVGLAGGLMGVLLASDTVGRMEALRWRIRRLLEELQKTRYAVLPGLLSLLVAERMGVSLEPHRAERRKRQGKGRPPWPTEADEIEEEEAAEATTPAPASAEPPPARPEKAPTGKPLPPALPRKFEDFQALVDGAFCAPQAAPAEGKERELLDEVAQMLWERLHLFEQAMEEEEQGLEEELEAMGETAPKYKDDVEERRWQIEHVLGMTGVAEEEKTLLLACRQQLGQLLTLRYGSQPGIERFLEWAKWGRLRD